MGGPRINEDEIKHATKLAARKVGVTHAQLAADLSVNEIRAAEILRRAPLKRERTPDGKRARLHTFFTRDSHKAWKADAARSITRCSRCGNTSIDHNGRRCLLKSRKVEANAKKTGSAKKTTKKIRAR